MNSSPIIRYLADQNKPKAIRFAPHLQGSCIPPKELAFLPFAALFFWTFAGAFVLSLAFLCTGCKPQPANPAPVSKTLDLSDCNGYYPAQPGRFRVSTHGAFYAGGSDTVREIFILTDTSNRVEYLGVTDASLIQLPSIER